MGGTQLSRQIGGRFFPPAAAATEDPSEQCQNNDRKHCDATIHASSSLRQQIFWKYIHQCWVSVRKRKRRLWVRVCQSIMVLWMIQFLINDTVLDVQVFSDVFWCWMLLFKDLRAANANTATRRLALQTQQIGSWSNQRGSCQQKDLQACCQQKWNKSKQEVNQRPLKSR